MNIQFLTCGSSSESPIDYTASTSIARLSPRSICPASKLDQSSADRDTMPSHAATIEESLESLTRNQQAIHADADVSVNTTASLSFVGSKACLAHSVPPLRPLADQQPPEGLQAPLRQSKMEVEAERSLLPGQNNKSPIECTR